MTDISEKIKAVCEEFKETFSVPDERRIRLWRAARSAEEA